MSADPAAASRAMASPAGAWRPWIGPVVAALAFAAGLATDALSAGRQVNLLAAPMLGLLAWNLAVYASMLVRSLAAALGGAHRAPGPIGRAMLRAGRISGRLGVDAPADAARAAQALHAASAALAAGMLAGLYLRGLAFEYLAGWESTFLDAEGVRMLLGLVHGPASALTGIALPDARALAAIRFSEGPGESAARWIHLLAASVTLYVILPRTLLSIRAGLQARRLARASGTRARRPATGSAADRLDGLGDAPPEDRASFAGISAGADGSIRVRALPYSFGLSAAGERGLRALLATELGPAAALELAPSVAPELAESPAGLADLPDGSPQLLLLLFTLSATPEPQTHAAFATELARRVRPETSLRVLVDETAFRARFAGVPQRLAQRREAWRAVFAGTGLAPRFAALGEVEAPGAPAAARPAAQDGSAAGAGDRNERHARRARRRRRTGRAQPGLAHQRRQDHARANAARPRHRRDPRRRARHRDRRGPRADRQPCRGPALALGHSGLRRQPRLARRLEQSGNPVGWILTQVWDRLRDRPLWSSQQAIRNVRERADVVLYLVNAAEDPADASYLDPELRILDWMGRPVIALLNQTGAPRPPEQESAEIARWRDRLSGTRTVKEVLALDAFARCWVQEIALLDAVARVLPAPRQAAITRLRAAWQARSEATFEASMRELARRVARAATDAQALPAGGLRDRLLDLGGALALGMRRSGGDAGAERADTARQAAMRALAERLDADIRASTDRLIALHGLEGRAAQVVLERLADHYAVTTRIDEGRAAVLGGLVAGSLAGLKADIATGGLTLGGGLLAGGLLGALGAAGLARGYNLVRGAEVATVTWADEILDGLVASALIGYLAVAHYGRGRGDWTASEHPPHWETVVREALAPGRDALRALWARRARRPGADELAAAMEPELEAAARRALSRLYPASPALR